MGLSRQPFLLRLPLLLLVLIDHRVLRDREPTTDGIFGRQMASSARGTCLRYRPGVEPDGEAGDKVRSLANCSGESPAPLITEAGQVLT